MLYRRILPPLLVFSLTAPLLAHAATLRDISREKITSRRVYSEAKYSQNLDRLEYLWGRIRRRPTVRTRTYSNEMLRLPRVRYVRQGRTKSGVINRKRLIQTPVLKKTGLSLISRLPVSTETEAAYRNGINYYTGKGVTQNKAFAFMWLNFAMAEGHPMARSALMRVSRTMTRNELEKAKEQAKTHTRRPFMNLTDHVKTAGQIRDDIRRRDLETILDAITRYRYNNPGGYPDKIPTNREIEICEKEARTCIDIFDMRPVVPSYLLSIPSDPFSPVDDNGTGYFIIKDKDGILTLYAKYSEGELVEVKSE